MNCIWAFYKQLFFIKNGPILASICLFSSFQPVTTLIHYYIDKSIDIVLGIRTRRVQDGRRKQIHISLQTTKEALMYLYFASTAAQMDP